MVRPDSEEDSLGDGDIPEQKTVRISIIGTFLVLLVGALFFAKGFLLPVVLSILMALVLSPVVRMMGRWRIPEGASAFLLVLLLGIGVGGVAWSLSSPVTELIRNAPQIGLDVRVKLASLMGPIEAVKEVTNTIEEAARPKAEPGVQEVVVREPGLLSWAAEGMPELLAGSALTLVLLLFLLASGDLFYEKLVRSLPTLTDKKRWLRIVYDVERDVSRYLFTLAAINFCLGVCIGLGLYLAGMPDPLVWAVAAALLNFVPYLGSLLGILIVAAVSVVSFPTLGEAAVPPLIYASLTALEGQFVTPALLGRRLRINAVAVFLAIAFWGWLWGAIGMLIAVPLLILAKTFAHHAEGLNGLREFLGVRESATEDSERTGSAAD